MYLYGFTYVHTLPCLNSSRKNVPNKHEIAVTDLENNKKSCQEKTLTLSLRQAGFKPSAELK